MAEVILKSLAQVTDTDPSDAPYGGFEAIASTPELDRDGDVITQKDWEPLPDKITIDVDHSMDVRGTIGSARPYFNENGNLCISAKFASTPLAQEVRSLMTEGHIDSVSVAFMRNNSKSADGEKKSGLELLNVGVVAIPSNRGAKVLAAKSLRVLEEFDSEPELKLGARNNANDAKHIQAAHDHLVMLGAQCQGGPEDSSGADADAEGGKSLTADVETKDSEHPEDAPENLASATDAALDQAIALLASVDTSNLAPEVQQAIALILAADNSVDELLEAMDVPDPDEDSTEETDSDAAEKSAASDSVDSADVVARALQFAIECEALTLSDDE